MRTPYLIRRLRVEGIDKRLREGSLVRLHFLVENSLGIIEKIEEDTNIAYCTIVDEQLKEVTHYDKLVENSFLIEPSSTYTVVCQTKIALFRKIENAVETLFSEARIGDHKKLHDLPGVFINTQVLRELNTVFYGGTIISSQ